MKTAKVLPLLVGLALPVLAAEKGTGLLGHWQCQGEEGAVALEFQSASRLVFDGELSAYRLAPGVIQVQEDFGPVDYPYTLKGGRLTIVFPEGDRLQCQKAAAARQAPAPAAGAGGGNPAVLQGRLCSWSGSSSSSSSYSRTSSLAFDGRGNVMYGAEASFSSDAGQAYGSGGGTPGAYRVSGDTVHIQLQDGSTAAAQVKMRQSSGRITELMINGRLYASGLCE